jgi:hypothetical protein
VRWRRRSKPEIALQFTLGRLAAPHRLRDQLIRQNQPRVGDVLHGQEDVGVINRRRIVAVQPDSVALDAGKRSAEPFAAMTGDGHLDLDEVTCMTLEIRAAHQRPIDAGRGNFQPVGPFDGVGDIEHRRKCARNRLAIFDVHRSVRPFGHDLDRATCLAGDPDPDQPIAHLLQHGRSNRRDTRGDARLDDQARLGQQVGVIGTRCRIGHVQRQSRS